MYPQGYSSNNANAIDMRAERNTPRHQRSISTPESDLISEAPMYHVEPSKNNANRNGRRCSGSTSDMFSQPQQQQQTSPFKNLQNRRVSGGGLTTIGHQQPSDKNGHYQQTNYFPSTSIQGSEHIPPERNNISSSCLSNIIDSHSDLDSIERVVSPPPYKEMSSSTITSSFQPNQQHHDQHHLTRHPPNMNPTMGGFSLGGSKSIELKRPDSVITTSSIISSSDTEHSQAGDSSTESCSGGSSVLSDLKHMGPPSVYAMSGLYGAAPIASSVPSAGRTSSSSGTQFVGMRQAPGLSNPNHTLGLFSQAPSTEFNPNSSNLPASKEHAPQPYFASKPQAKPSLTSKLDDRNLQKYHHASLIKSNSSSMASHNPTLQGESKLIVYPEISKCPEYPKQTKLEGRIRTISLQQSGSNEPSKTTSHSGSNRQGQQETSPGHAGTSTINNPSCLIKRHRRQKSYPVTFQPIVTAHHPPGNGLPTLPSPSSNDPSGYGIGAATEINYSSTNPNGAGIDNVLEAIEIEKSANSGGGTVVTLVRHGSNPVNGHRRSHSYGPQRPSQLIHAGHLQAQLGHRRTGSSVIETLQTLTGSCGHGDPNYNSKEASLAQFLEMLKKEQQEKCEKAELDEMKDELEDLRDCGLGECCRPAFFQPLANIKVFVFLLSVLVTLQQALSSGYLNSVITTIEKRYEIPSSISGIIASMYEIGNVITVIFVSYLGSRRHIPVWIGMGVLVMGIGSVTFSLPHFLTTAYSETYNNDGSNSSTENICSSGNFGNRGEGKNSALLKSFASRIDNFGSSSEGELLQKLPGLEKIKSLTEGLSQPPLAPHQSSGQYQTNREDVNCIEQANESSALPIFIFMVAQLLLGCGGSPLFTLGTTYIDNHVKRDSSSMYIGFMYSMCAFGPVCGFLLGAYLLSHDVDTFSSDMHLNHLDSSDRRWIGMWWGGFLICGVSLIVISIPFFFFPKELKKEKVKVYIDEKYHHAEDSIRPPQKPKSLTASTDNHLNYCGTATNAPSQAPAASGSITIQSASNQTSSNVVLAASQMSTPKMGMRNINKSNIQRRQSLTGNPTAKSGCNSRSSTLTRVTNANVQDDNYGKDIKNIPKATWKLLTNKIYIVTCLGACTELIIVSGFIVFLPKYLETQFNLSKSMASMFTGGIAIPGACIGIFLGGYLLKRFQLRPSGAVQLVLFFNILCLSCYALLFFFGCENVKMAGATEPYFDAQRNQSEPFQINLTASCNFGCECDVNDVQPVCGANGLTYFSPCHAGCTDVGSTSDNFTNCACVLNTLMMGSKTKTDHELDYEDLLERQFGSPLLHASSDWPISSVNVGGNKLTPGSSSPSSFAQRQQRPRSPVPAAAAIHERHEASRGDNFAEVTYVPVATAGPCRTDCQMVMPFMVLLFFMTLLVAVTQMPVLMVVLRSVEEEAKAFALGIQFVIFRLFGYIPSPILFGNVIDSTCILWKSTCDGEAGGRCLMYDIEMFRYKYVGVCCGIKVVSCLIFLFDYWLIRKRQNAEKKQAHLTMGEVVNSIISLDKLFDPEGPLWIQVVDPENPEELSDDNLAKENAENEQNNALNAMTAHDDEDELEPPSPSKPVYENTACLQKKRINK